MTTSLITLVTYGAEAESLDHPVIEAATRALDVAILALSPGNFLVVSFPYHG